MIIQYQPKRGGINGLLSIEQIVVLAFLRRQGDLNALKYPTGRGSGVDVSVLQISSDKSRQIVYEKYQSGWLSICNGTIGSSSGNCSETEITPCKDSFRRAWNGNVPTLKIHKADSDFCDTCLTLQETADCLTTATAPLHLNFYFPQNVLLPSLLKQPGHLQFITGVNFDLFGLNKRKQKKIYIFGLPEGHWPGHKTCNEVASMLQYVITIQKNASPLPPNVK